MTPPLAIGIDLGGTNIKAAIVDRDGNIVHRLEQPTEASRGPGPVIDDLADIVRRLSTPPLPPGSDEPTEEGGSEGRGEGTVDLVIGIGLATPGPLNLREGRIIRGANLPAWKDVSIRYALRQKTGLPVMLENDGNAAAYGEYRCGAGRDGGDLVMLTLGTGVGAGVILDGRILHGHFDNAAELGHMIVLGDGLPCPCGQRGCLEQYASANAIVHRVLHAGPDHKYDAPRAIRAEDVARAAANGDSLCGRVWDDACLYLAIACVNIQHTYNPSKIVLGGGLGNAGAQLLDRVKAYFRRHTWSLHADAPEIVLSQLGSDAGVIGAAMLAFLPTA